MKIENVITLIDKSNIPFKTSYHVLGDSDEFSFGDILKEYGNDGNEYIIMYKGPIPSYYIMRPVNSNSIITKNMNFIKVGRIYLGVDERETDLLNSSELEVIKELKNISVHKSADLKVNVNLSKEEIISLIKGSNLEMERMLALEKQSFLTYSDQYGRVTWDMTFLNSMTTRGLYEFYKTNFYGNRI